MILAGELDCPYYQSYSDDSAFLFLMTYLIRSTSLYGVLASLLAGGLSLHLRRQCLVPYRHRVELMLQD